MNEMMIERVHVENLRLECLKLAYMNREGHETGGVITEAQRLMDFITNGVPTQNEKEA